MSLRPEDLTPGEERERCTRGQATGSVYRVQRSPPSPSAPCPRARTCRPLRRVRLFLDVLMKEVLHPESRCPDGVRFHCIGVYLDELTKVGGKEVSPVPSQRSWDPGRRAVGRGDAGSGGPGLALCHQPPQSMNRVSLPFDIVLSRLRMCPDSRWDTGTDVR